MTRKAFAENEKKRLIDFINGDNFSYRHLDWALITDWIGDPGFLYESADDEIVASICCTPESSGVAWLRYFAASRFVNIIQTWNNLLNDLIPVLQERNINQIACLGLTNWMEELLIKSEFQSDDSIVFLNWYRGQTYKQTQSEELVIRMMIDNDLPRVVAIDHLSFTPLWQYSPITLSKAYHLSSYNTVALLNNDLIGYQMTSESGGTAHLSRLAVSPPCQRSGIATALITDVQKHLQDQGTTRISLNTQLNNFASLTVYRRLGFEQSNDKIIVYTKEI